MSTSLPAPTRAPARAASWISLVVLLLMHAGAALAQQAMTVTGHVTYAGAPLVGARIRIVELDAERVTDAEGRYSFVIGAARVRGQTVTLMARLDDRRIRYLAQSVELVLAGGAIVQDFTLTVAEDLRGSRDGLRTGDLADGRVLDDVALHGAGTLLEALAGRVPGLDIRAAAEAGGAVFAEHRGQRSLVGGSEPLVVIDGVPVDNTVYATATQRSGLGGFDYGTALRDLPLSSVASVRWASRADGVARFGGRAANGVVLVTTRDGAGLLGTTISAEQTVTLGAPRLLTRFQDAYGQGLDGRFQFFDGKGGGINDGVDESWGPALDGRPLQQASVTEAGRPVVSFFSPKPGNVRDYFRTARLASTSVAVQHGGAFGSLRVFADTRDERGVTPAQLVTQRAGGVGVTLRPSATLTMTGRGMFARTTNEDAPGIGFSEENPVSQFTRLGRQVDVRALATHRRDSAGRQVSWNYAGHNNPFFAALENDNRSRRTHGFGAASLAYTPAPWLSATVQGGLDGFHDARRLNVARGWMGAYPALGSTSDYALGVSSRDDIDARRGNIAASLEAVRSLGGGVQWRVGVGAEHAGVNQSAQSTSVDSASRPLREVTSAGWQGSATRDGVFAQAGLTLGTAGVATLSARQEWTTLDSLPRQSAVFPAATVSYDFGRTISGLADNAVFNGVEVHGAWSRSGADLSPYLLYGSDRVLRGASSSGVAPAQRIGQDSALVPEVTQATEGGLTFRFARRRLAVGATIYSEVTDGVVVPRFDRVTALLSNANAGQVANRGVEGEASLHLGDSRSRSEWSVSLTAAHNTNRVESLGDTTQAVRLGPTLPGGVGIEARVGSPLGVLVGSRSLRDAASGDLLLRNGLPQVDSAAGLQELGTSQPRWVMGFSTSLRRGQVTLALLADAHLGGQFFSASRLSGSQAGTLEDTGFRPDSGLLIQGLDAATRLPNMRHVTAQDYFHALATIQDPWVYSATYAKLRDASVSLALPTTMSALPFERATISLVGHNLLMWSRVKDIDPESTSRSGAYRGVELGQLPYARSIGVRLSITP